MNCTNTVRERNYALDFLKIVGTVIIFIYHYQQLLGVRFLRINVFGGIFDASCMVELFFVLSGYFMCTYETKIKDGLDFKTFYIKRVSRLLPVVAVVAVFFNVANILHRKAFAMNWFGMPITLWGTITSALGISQGWGLPESYVNYAMWYISALLLCYCVFYLINYIAKRCNLPTEYMYIVMICIGMGGLTYGANQIFYTYGTSRGYYAFFYGILLKKILDHIKISKSLVLGCLVLITGYGLLIIKTPTYATDGLYFIMTFFIFPAIIVLLHTDFAKKIFKYKIIGTMSAISFNVYVWHSSLIIALMSLNVILGLNINFSSKVTVGISLVFSYLVGTISHYLIEKPIDRYIQSKVFKA